MNAIIGQVDAAQQLENIDYKRYVHNVLSLLSPDMAIKASGSRDALLILERRYLVHLDATVEYRDIAEKIIAALTK